MVPASPTGDSGVFAKWFWHSRQVILACPAGGARPLRRLLSHTVETELSKEIIKGVVKEGDTVIIDFDNDKFSFTVAD